MIILIYLFSSFQLFASKININISISDVHIHFCIDKNNLFGQQN